MTGTKLLFKSGFIFCFLTNRKPILVLPLLKDLWYKTNETSQLGWESIGLPSGRSWVKTPARPTTGVF